MAESSPTWHAPWNLYRVITGNTGWITSIAFDPSNSWFCTGSSDRTIKLYDLSSDDNQVKCWDLAQNKVIRSYHGHLSGVYCVGLHPSIDNVLVTGGRDCVVRVWDVRSRTEIYAMEGHRGLDATVKFWDIRSGKLMERCFVAASGDNVKKFGFPSGEFMHDMLCQQNAIINTMAVNEDGVLATGGDNGSLWFWDWKSGYNFHQEHRNAQPGSLDSERCIKALSYDMTGSRLVTCEADKTIKMWKQDENATPETHPLNYLKSKEMRRF
ncbi:malonyl-CoA decarboxylase [Ranunculus cassubicifolius]